MAHAADMSRAGFAAAFKEVIGQSPGNYVTRLRMGHAEDALLRTDATLATISADVGYTNEFAFATAFRRTHGLPPGRWRAAHRPTLQREPAEVAHRDAGPCPDAHRARGALARHIRGPPCAGS
ncbi:helix-turn-helix transcriptional regulator [Streptomyces sp. NPDC092369]|uniref:helix-turn-helix transcriptional regulator n=1 Tax=Streptomyces sp. NPDC092369 TaxID=3366015 RepID=UPI00380A5982